MLNIKHLVHSTNCQKQLCNLRCGIQHLLSLHAFIIINIEIFILKMLQHDIFPPFKVKMQCLISIDANHLKTCQKEVKMISRLQNITIILLYSRPFFYL